VGQTGFRAAATDLVSTDLVSTDLVSADLVGRPAVDLLRTDSALCR
jgi:hypothetical protein